MRIMLAEDSVLMRDGLVVLLERAQHDVVAQFATADEVRHRLDRDDADLPDLLISDVRMPPAETDDGLRAAVGIRERHPALPVLLLSQWLGSEYLLRLMSMVRSDPNSGGVGYLLKDRIAHVRDFIGAVDAVAGGGIVVDPQVIAGLMDQRRRPFLSDAARAERSAVGVGRRHQPADICPAAPVGRRGRETHQLDLRQVGAQQRRGEPQGVGRAHLFAPSSLTVAPLTRSASQRSRFPPTG